VVVHVLVAERDADNPLPDQGRQGVHHLVLLAAILKARRDPLDQPDGSIGVAQQQTAGGGRGRVGMLLAVRAELEGDRPSLFQVA
jgi:hypothetical protein